MQNRYRYLLTTLSLMLCSTCTFAEQATSWPYPEDTPQSRPLSIGLAGTQPVDISRFLLSRGVSQSRINAQGTHVAFTSNVTGTRQLWVKSLDGGEATQITFGNGISFYQWHPDGERLLYSADNNGNERPAYYFISRDGRQEQLILDHSNAFRRFGQFDATGNLFTYASTERNGRDFDIYQHDLRSGESSMIYQAEFGFFPAARQPGTANILVTETRGEDAQDVYILNTESGEIAPLYQPKVAASFSDFNWSKDGKTLYFLSNLDREMTAVHQYDTESQTTTVLEMGEGQDSLHLCNNQTQMVMTGNKNGFSVLQIATLANKKFTYTALPGDPGVLSVSCAANKDIIAVQKSTPASPGEIMTLNAKAKNIEPVVSATLAGIEPSSLVHPEVMTFPARDGVTVQGLLYLPENTRTAVPLVVDVHGGPTAQARPSWQPLTQYLVGKGIAVLDINVRGSTGFGKTYARLDNQEKRLDSVRDLVDALVYLEDDPRIDTNNAAVMGGSYGGYMVNAVMGLYPDAFKAGASFVGVSDWVRALQQASPGLKASDRIEYGDIREPKWQEFYAENSPINTVHNITAPMFFEHGVNDPRDPVTESDRMVRILREKGLDVTYLRFPDEGHSVSKLENRVTFYRALADFLERHLVNDKS
ncbi:S9 family peptidase [Alteromonas gilva]|uniref:Acyl-peptide hydrolase n=1 Tax=Alteromonas gilva TaxID=2987522 RepID=A0ABT5KYI5_9ALTE|nr:S9 family peptidase [Alteromonas gilva]MDC8829316.1 S9 family peptidase [Alteromonas gilva]